MQQTTWAWIISSSLSSACSSIPTVKGLFSWKALASYCPHDHPSVHILLPTNEPFTLPKFSRSSPSSHSMINNLTLRSLSLSLPPGLLTCRNHQRPSSPWTKSATSSWNRPGNFRPRSTWWAIRWVRARGSAQPRPVTCCTVHARGSCSVPRGLVRASFAKAHQKVG
jgi:hypothetical protein